MDLRNFSKAITLRNGVKATVRAIRSDDAERFRRAFAGLEKTSIYTRFFAFRPALSETELKAATDVDFIRTVALVVTLDADPETIVAGGRYIRFNTPDDNRAEVAFTVEEDYQKLGLASLLLHELAIIARRAGITMFVADVLLSNSPMLQVFRRSGFAMKSTMHDGTLHVELDLLKRAA
jgi:GNAT superfamily N-acetyltransferase